jgi:hypothetical protein
LSGCWLETEWITKDNLAEASYRFAKAARKMIGEVFILF